MPVGYTENNSNNIDFRSNDEKDDTVVLGWRIKKGEKKEVEEERVDNLKIRVRELIILKSESKPDEGGFFFIFFFLNNDDDKNMVQTTRWTTKYSNDNIAYIYI